MTGLFNVNRSKKILEQDLKIVDDYFRSTRLLMNPNKTEVSAFHLNHKEADRQLQVSFRNQILNHNFKFKFFRNYFGS